MQLYSNQTFIYSDLIYIQLLSIAIWVPTYLVLTYLVPTYLSIYLPTSSPTDRHTYLPTYLTPSLIANSWQFIIMTSDHEGSFLVVLVFLLSGAVTCIVTCAVLSCLALMVFCMITHLRLQYHHHDNYRGHCTCSTSHHGYWYNPQYTVYFILFTIILLISSMELHYKQLLLFITS